MMQITVKGIVLLGRPGSGKSTYGKQLCEQHGMKYISSGDIAREMAQTDTETRDNLSGGKMANEKLMRNAIFGAVSSAIARGEKFVLDGFPRTIDQLYWMDLHFFNQISYHIVDTPEDECISRLLKRGRSDDDYKTIVIRMQLYNDQTEPMVQLIRGRADV